MEQNLKTDAVTLTKTLCNHLASAQFSDLTPQAVHAARRGVLDWIGCALAGSTHRTVTTLLDVLRETSGRPQATVLGRKLRLGLLDAPLANGTMGHVLDYDDTHMGGVVLHTSSPVLAALFALAERAPVSGAEFMLAYATGFEAGVRCGRAAPGHHKGGWHLTGTLGSIAAGAASGRLIKLDGQRLTYALGIAATQAAGMQQNRGTMCKSLHAGKAASNGVLAALLAERGFDSTQEIVEGKRGFARIYSDTAAPEQLAEGLGGRWLIESNGHKPYACGVVLHPLIDAVIALRNRHSIDPASVSEIALRVHPLVLSITGVKEPATGLQSKFSVAHSAAVALHDGAAGIGQYSDAKAAPRRGPRRDRGRRGAPRGAYRARQRHGGQSDERRGDRGQVPGQCRFRHRYGSRRARPRFRPVAGKTAGRARIACAAWVAVCTVIPGRATGAIPESIAPASIVSVDRGYGFRHSLRSAGMTATV
jgi:2-methylcitrate dehydratase PrpD